jgi:Amt family ammonium transporter
VDDSFDLFAQHAVGGSLGLLANAFFASHSVIALDRVNTNVPGGWVDHNWKQFYIQIAYVVAACSYTFIVTFLIAHLINIIPGLHLRVTAEGEIVGLDEVEVCLDTLLNFPCLTGVQIGEFANDYIEVSRDVMELSTTGMNQRELTLDTIVVADDDCHGPKSLEQKGQQSDTHIEDVDTDSMEKF